MHPFPSAFACICIYAGIAASAAAEGPWALHELGYKVEDVAGGFQLPVNIAFVPEARASPDLPLFYVTELYGTVKTVDASGAVGIYAENLLNFNPLGDFPGTGEIGLAGIVVDPANGDVIVSMVHRSDEAGNPLLNRVVRMRSSDGGRTASSMETLIDMTGSTTAHSHQISNLSFGPDGMLYIHTGDGKNPDTARDPDSWLGKILRATPAGGAPTDNPFYDASDGIGPRDYVYTLGHRNPFGGAWRALDGGHYIVENGPSTDRFAVAAPGRDFEWDGQDTDMLAHAIYHWSPSVAPVNIAFVQRETFSGSDFPPSAMDCGFVTESGDTWAAGIPPYGKRISRLCIDPGGRGGVEYFPFLSYAGAGRASVSAIAAGPDGLYFSDLYKDDEISAIDPGAHVWRIRHTGVVDFAAVPLGGGALEFHNRTTLSGVESWLWNFGDGATSAEVHPTHAYTGDGVYTVALTATRPTGFQRRNSTVYIQRGRPGGMVADYFNDAGMKSFSFSRIDPNVDFDWLTGSPDERLKDDDFGIRWSGMLVAPTSGTYEFRIVATGSARLWIGNTLVGEVVSPFTIARGPVAMTAGQPQDFRMEFGEDGGGASVRLFWGLGQQSAELVPPQAFLRPQADLAIRSGAIVDNRRRIIVTNSGPATASGVMLYARGLTPDRTMMRSCYYSETMLLEIPMPPIAAGMSESLDLTGMNLPPMGVYSDEYDPKPSDNRLDGSANGWLAN